MRFHASVSASSIIYAPSEAASEGPHPEKSTPLGPGGALSREARTGFEAFFGRFRAATTWLGVGGQFKNRCLPGRAGDKNPKKRCIPSRFLFS